MNQPVQPFLQKSLLVAIAFVLILAYMGLFITYPRSADRAPASKEKTSNYSMPHLVPVVKMAAAY